LSTSFNAKSFRTRALVQVLALVRARCNKITSLLTKMNGGKTPKNGNRIMYSVRHHVREFFLLASVIP
jgi:hypothetical protein